MKILLISHAMVVDTYRRSRLCLANKGQNTLKLLAPKKWQEAGQIIRSESKNEAFDTAHTLRFYKFHGATFLYGFKLFSLMRTFKPDIIHLEEEPYSLAALQVIILRWLVNRQSKLIFFTWQNIHKRYLPPFNLIEKLTLISAAGGIAGNTDAAEILKMKGFDKPISVIPQYGVDSSLFNGKGGRTGQNNSKKIIGYVGRLEYDKGIDILIKAVAKLRADYELWIVGNGTYFAEILKVADECKIAERLRVYQNILHREVPEYLRNMDVLVLPSRTGQRWKEQFGRVLVEAMSCGVPVIGSSSGAIPEVVDGAGVVFPEDNVDTLRWELYRILTDMSYQVQLRRKGRDRVLNNYTNDVLASKTLEFYTRVTKSS